MLIKDTMSDDFLVKAFSLTESNIGALCTLTNTKTQVSDISLGYKFMTR